MWLPKECQRWSGQIQKDPSSIKSRQISWSWAKSETNGASRGASDWELFQFCWQNQRWKQNWKWSIKIENLR